MTLGCLWVGVVVEDGVDRRARRHPAFDGVEEADELLMAVLEHAAPDDGAVEDVEGGEQGGNAVALGIVGHGAAFAGLEREARLGAIEGLDLALFVHREHHGVGRRVHVQADNVAQLVGEVGIGGALEGSDTVRLESVGGPDALHRAQADANRLGHHPAAPVGGIARRLPARQRHHPRHRRGRQRRLARRPGLVAQQTGHPLLGVTPLPAPHRRPPDPGPVRHLRHRQPLRRQKNDPSPHHVLVQTAPLADHRGQSRALFGSNDHADILCHPHSIAHLQPIMNLLYGSMH